MNPGIHKLHLHQFDRRVKQWWADELTDEELELIAKKTRTVAQVLQERNRGCSHVHKTGLQRLCGQMASLLRRTASNH